MVGFFENVYKIRISVEKSTLNVYTIRRKQRETKRPNKKAGGCRVLFQGTWRKPRHLQEGE